MNFEIAQLSNGLPVILSRAPGTPRTAVCLTLRGGRRVQGQPGVARLAASLLLKGTPSRTAEQIADEMDRRAIDLEEISGTEYTMLRGTFLNAQLEPALDLMGDLVQHSTFADLPKEAARLAGEIQASLDQPPVRARDLFLRTLFPGHPYGHTGSLILKSLPTLDVEGVRSWYQSQLGGNQMNITVVGDVDPDTLMPLLEARFGGIAPHTNAPAPPRVIQAEVPVVATEVKAEAQQAQIFQGWYTPGHRSPDRAPLAVLNTVLGASGLSSRLFVELRDKRGLAYSVHSGFSTHSDIGLFSLYIGTSGENIRRALEGFAEQIDRICNDPITTEELKHAQGHLQGEFVLAQETNTQRCTDFAVHHILGLGPDFTARLLEEILATRIEDVQRVAQQYLSRPPATAIVATQEALAAAGLPAS